MQSYEVILTRTKPQVSFGYTKIHVYQPSELESGQVGYSISPNGVRLTGDDDGDWRESWLVIGYDETCGDPIFIDTSKNGYPVYTAIMGMGRWDPRPVAVSLEAFAHSLSAVAAVAHGRENPVLLEQNPLTESDKKALLATIQICNLGMDVSYWEAILSNS